MNLLTEPSGVMFHHFHGGNHHPSPGSIDSTTLERLLDRIAATKTILSANEFCEKARTGVLLPTDTCLTFDDALKCQSEIAAQVLGARNLTGFFFVYSTAFAIGGAELEVFRDFRSRCYESTDSFLEDLLTVLVEVHPTLEKELDVRFPSDYLARYSFYSTSDRRLRFLRDEMLTPDEYSSAMHGLMTRHGVDAEESRKRLVMDTADLQLLASNGHQIGLHSHTHNTRIDLLDEHEASQEYENNFEFIRNVTGAAPVSMSHPLGRHSPNTLAALRNLDIFVGFIDSPTPNSLNEPLCIPRHDHSDLVKQFV